MADAAPSGSAGLVGSINPSLQFNSTPVASSNPVVTVSPTVNFGAITTQGASSNSATEILFVGAIALAALYFFDRS